MERLFDLNALQTFVTTVRLGSMAKAATALGIPKSTISRHLAKVEKAMNVVLIRRLPNGIATTVAGQILFDQTVAGISAIRSSYQRAGTDHPGDHAYRSTPPLRIRAPIVFGRGFLPGIIASAARLYPGLRLDVTLAERIFDPDDESHDINFCVGIDVPSHLESWILGHLEAKFYASPAYLATIAISKPDDLQQARVLTLKCPPNAPSLITLLKDDGQSAAINVFPFLQSNENAILLQAALDGLGVCRLPEFLARPHVSDGSLINLLASWTAARHIVSISAAKGFRQPSVQGFIEFAATQLSTELAVPVSE
jgi:DNA-binding transcriptional LysR family regulator